MAFGEADRRRASLGADFKLPKNPFVERKTIAIFSPLAYNGHKYTYDRMCLLWIEINSI